MAKKGLGKGLNSLFNEEDIEEVFWLNTKETEQMLPQTYASLRSVFQSILQEKRKL